MWRLLIAVKKKSFAVLVSSWRAGRGTIQPIAALTSFYVCENESANFSWLLEVKVSRGPLINWFTSPQGRKASLSESNFFEKKKAWFAYFCQFYSFSDFIFLFFAKKMQLFESTPLKLAKNRTEMWLNIKDLGITTRQYARNEMRNLSWWCVWEISPYATGDCGCGSNYAGGEGRGTVFTGISPAPFRGRRWNDSQMTHPVACWLILPVNLNISIMRNDFHLVFKQGLIPTF